MSESQSTVEYRDIPGFLGYREDVTDIRRRRAAGEILRSIAASYGVTLQAIHLVCARKNWKGVA